MLIKTYEEWARDPSYHGSYSDYVCHMQYEEQRERDRFADEVAERVAKKLAKRR